MQLEPEQAYFQDLLHIELVIDEEITVPLQKDL